MKSKQAQEDFRDFAEDEFEKVQALAEFLNISPEEIEVGHSASYLAAEGGEYLVLTEEEAQQAVKEEIENSLWAFNPEWLEHWLEVPAEAIKAIQEKMYEDASPVFMKMLGDKFDAFVEESVSADGRGHFLAHYDSEENEATIGDTWYYIYRTN